MTSAARLSLEEVDHVAHLARLDLDPDERQRFSLELGAVLEYVGRLAEVDTEGVQPAFASQPRLNVFREDRVCEPLGPHAVLANAPARQGDYFRIPRILEED
jgi:aspartyl-tRNA(Asn)/glutamyl-tRNA(Gln) amidotransferase subunit C